VYNGAAKCFGVPLITLRDHVDGRVHLDILHAGAAPLFNQKQESNIVEHVKTMSEIGYGYTRAEVVDLASDYAVNKGNNKITELRTILQRESQNS
jgi:hypothetical protein